MGPWMPARCSTAHRCLRRIKIMTLLFWPKHHWFLVYPCWSFSPFLEHWFLFCYQSWLGYMYMCRTDQIMTTCIDHVVCMRNLCSHHAQTAGCMHSQCANYEQLHVCRELRATSLGVGCPVFRRHPLARTGKTKLHISCAQFTNCSRMSQNCFVVPKCSTCWKMFHALDALSRTFPHVATHPPRIGTHGFVSLRKLCVNQIACKYQRGLSLLSKTKICSLSISWSTSTLQIIYFWWTVWMSSDEIFFPFTKCTVAEAVVPFRKCTAAEAVVPFRKCTVEEAVFPFRKCTDAEAVVPFRKCTVAEAVVPFRNCTVAEAVEVSMSTIHPTDGTFNVE